VCNLYVCMFYDDSSIAVESYEGVSHSHQHHRGGRGNHSHESSPTNPSQEGYFVENVSETGSSSAETGMYTFGLT